MGTHQYYIGKNSMLIDNIVFAYFIVSRKIKTGRIVFCTIYYALLKRGIEFTPRTMAIEDSLQALVAVIPDA